MDDNPNTYLVTLEVVLYLRGVSQDDVRVQAHDRVSVLRPLSVQIKDVVRRKPDESGGGGVVPPPTDLLDR